MLTSLTAWIGATVRRHRPRREVSVDQAPWDWYERSCPCGLPPGECREHPRARETQRGCRPGGRLAGLGVRGWARGRQDACRSGMGPAPREGGNDEAGMPDRPHE